VVEETLSIEVTCTNRGSPRSSAWATSPCPRPARRPSRASRTSRRSPSPCARPSAGLHWRLISHLALNYRALADAEALRAILDLYNFQALIDRQAARANRLRIEGIRTVSTRPVERLVKGVPVRGVGTTLELDEASFSGRRRPLPLRVRSSTRCSRRTRASTPSQSSSEGPPLPGEVLVEGEERAAADPVSEALIAQLARSPQRVGFYRAVELLERSTPTAVRVGELGPVPRRRPLSPRPVAHLRHQRRARDRAPRALRRRGRRRRRAGAVYEITSTFLGLTGTVSPLPTYFAEEVINEDDERPAQRQFLDLFHHRILSLFYRAHTRYSYGSDYLSNQQDAWSRRTLALAGIDTFDGRGPVVDLPLWRLLRLAPLLASRARTASGLVAVVSDTMSHILEGAGVSVEQFVGRWVSIDERQLFRLGVSNCTLGEDATIGRKVFDRGGKFRLMLGPLRRKAFQQFLPGSKGLDALREVVLFYVRDPLEFDVELILAPGETPSMRLSSRPGDGSRLGLDSWVTVNADRETRVIVPVPS
jgi:type VI secretion system protein ImpH